MPYMIVKSKKGFSVFKQDADGKPTGDPHNRKPYSSKAAAMPLLRALYAAENRKMKAAEMDAPPEDSAVEELPEPLEDAALEAEVQAAYALDMSVDDENPTGDEPPPDSEPLSEIVHEYGMTTEFKGGVPNVPDAAGIDKAALIKGDPNPTFVTMKIAQIGRTSKAGILYDQALVESIAEQINRKRVGGGFGHIKEEDADSAFPLPDGLWVGATLVGEYLFGKAYIRNRDAAKYVQDLKAVNGALGTSIWGKGVFTPAENGARRLTQLDLEKVDFAPPERASLNMGGTFELTHEMSTTGDQEMGVTKEALAEMTPADLYALLSDDARAAVAELYATKSKKKMIAAEMVSDAGFTPETVAEFEQLKADAPKLLRENKALAEQVAEYRKVEYQAGLQAVIDGQFADWKNIDKLDAKKQQRFNSVKTALRERVVAEMNGQQDLAIAKAKADAIAESDGFRPVMEMLRDDLAGTSAVVGGKNTLTPAEVAQALRDQRDAANA